jgi:hypothetical protein
MRAILVEGRRNIQIPRQTVSIGKRRAEMAKNKGEKKAKTKEPGRLPWLDPNHWMGFD